MKNFLRFTPTIFYILFTAFWFAQEYDSLGTFNYPSLALFVALILQLFTDNKTTGFLYSILFIIFSGYMLITAATSYADTEVVTDSTAGFYTMQFTVFGICLLMAGLMLFYNRYYIKRA